MRLVVVVLPLVPVTAAQCRSFRAKASSISLITGTPAARAAWTKGKVPGTPGESTTRRQPFNSRSEGPEGASLYPNSAAPAAASASSAMGLRSLKITWEPWRASAFAAARPLRAAPRTTTRLPLSWPKNSMFIVRPASAQFKGGDGRQHEQRSHDPEPHDHFAFRDALQLKMVVQGRHRENPLAPHLEAGDLHDDGKGLDDEDHAHQTQQDFLLRKDRHRAEEAAQRQGSGVAHEHLGRVGVEPEKPETGAQHGAAQDGHLPKIGHMRDEQIGAQSGVPHQVGDDDAVSYTHLRAHETGRN